MFRDDNKVTFNGGYWLFGFIYKCIDTVGTKNSVCDASQKIGRNGMMSVKAEYKIGNAIFANDAGNGI